MDAAAPTLAEARFRAGTPATSRSFRMHRHRGPFCDVGTCHRCPVRAQAGATALACEVPADDASVRRLDARRAIAWRAETLPPWFYERRFLRPRFVRRAAFELLRRLSSAPPLPAAPVAVEHGERTTIETDVLVVGAGPSGILAASAAAARGSAVTLVERDGDVGGSARVRGIASPATLDGIRVLTRSTCIGIYREEDLAAIVTPHGPIAVTFSRLVIATGAYDRPLAYGGNDLPGTIGVRAFERLAARRAFPDGVRIGLVAAPDEADRAAAAAHRAGLTLSWAAGPVTLRDDVATRVFIDRIARASGRRRIRRVELASAGIFPTDVLVIGFSQPTYELAVQAGGAPRVVGSPAIVHVSGTPDALVVGEAAGWIADPVGPTRTAVAEWLDVGRTTTTTDAPSIAPPNVTSPQAFACFCEDVRVSDLHAAVTDGFTDAELVKRRTGAGTGPCQGAYCAAEVVATLEDVGVASSVPTVRPPMHPVSLADLAVLDA